MEDTFVPPSTGTATRHRRRLKPEVAARFAQAQRKDLRELYQKPVKELTDGELDRMKAAFLAGE